MSDPDFLQIDMSDIKGGDFDAIPAGAYPVVVSDWSTTETKNEGKIPAGTPGINWEFTITEGDFENRKLWTNHWIHPNTLGFLKTFLLKAGAYTEDELNESFKLDPDKVLGKELVAIVVIKKYKGDDKNEIKKFKAKGEAAAATSGGSLLP